MDSLHRRAIEGDDRLASAKVRSRLFWLLADGLLNGHRAQSWSLIRHGERDDDMDIAWKKLTDALAAIDEDSQLRLAVEHTRLFGGLTEGQGPPPPFESAWRESIEAGAIPSMVARAYAMAGFADIDTDAGPQDHLAVELKFMAMLALREVAAREQGDSATVIERIRQQQEFLDQHLLNWVPRWTDTITHQTGEPLYRAFAEMVRAVMSLSAEDLAMPSAWGVFTFIQRIDLPAG